MKITVTRTQLDVAAKFGLSIEQYVKALADYRLYQKRMKKLLKQYRKKKVKK